MTRRIGYAFLLLAVITVSGAPTSSAAVPFAHPATAPIMHQVGTWEGQIESDGEHFDYTGVPCPIEAESCIQIVVKYRIMPLTDQARMTLPKVAGRSAQLKAILDKRSNDGHEGTLLVWKVIP